MRIHRDIVIEEPGQRAIDALAAALPSLSRQTIKHAMDKGAVWLKKSKGAQRLRRATKVLKPPQRLQIFYDERLLTKQPPIPQLLADLQGYSVWNKPAGLLAQGTHYGDHCSLLRFAEKHFNPTRECFLVHRLDADANGLMLIAHNRKAAAQFSELFKQRKITKLYRVCTQGLMKKTTTIDTPINGKPATTVVEKIKVSSNDNSELIVRIESGRKHQIRRHLAGIGHPVLGDTKYGGVICKEGLALSAIELKFECPITKRPQHFLLTENTSRA